MTEDPIVAEVRRTRAKMLEECGGDFERLMKSLGDREAKDHSRLVESPAELKKKTLRLAS